MRWAVTSRALGVLRPQGKRTWVKIRSASVVVNFLQYSLASLKILGEGIGFPRLSCHQSHQPLNHPPSLREGPSFQPCCGPAIAAASEGGESREDAP